MPAKATERQRELLEVVSEYRARNGLSPTLREIGDAMGISSTNGVGQILKALEKKGYITRTPGRSRSILLTEKSKEVEPRLAIVVSIQGSGCETVYCGERNVTKHTVHHGVDEYDAAILHFNEHDYGFSLVVHGQPINHKPVTFAKLQDVLFQDYGILFEVVFVSHSDFQ